jgi:hypothetical protein
MLRSCFLEQIFPISLAVDRNFRQAEYRYDHPGEPVPLRMLGARLAEQQAVSELGV